jgi:hypothetical protein
MAVEFDCEGCAVHVVSYGTDAIPRHHFCCMCEWLEEFVTDPEEMMILRKRLDLIDEMKRPDTARQRRGI